MSSRIDRVIGVASAAGERTRPETAYREITLLDILRVIHARRVLMFAIVGASVVAAGAVTYFATPQYESTARLIPLAYEGIIENWLGSRQAALVVSESIGARLHPSLYGDAWDAERGGWRGAAPTEDEIAQSLRGHVRVTGITPRRAEISITVTMPDAAISRDVAAAYVDALADLRPQLEVLTRGELFDKYYDGKNAQEAYQRADTTARQKSYWLAFDTPSTPTNPTSPRPAMNLGLGLLAGLVISVAVVFGLEWSSQYRAEFGAPPRR